MRAAVIGCGRMGAESSARLVGCIPQGWLPISHIESLLSIKEINSVALCDTEDDLLRSRGQRYCIDVLYTNYEDLITQFRPDILTIATRTPPKCKIIKFTCEHGVKGIYVEKPLANSLKELEECFFYIRKYNVQLFYGVNRRYHPVYRAAKKLINDGAIGEITTIVVEHGFSQLLWAHPHSVDLILFFADSCQVNSVQAYLDDHSFDISSACIINSDPYVEGMLFKMHQGIIAYITNAAGLNVRIIGKMGNITVNANGSYMQLNYSDENSEGYFLNQKNINMFSKESATVVAIKELIIAIKMQKPINNNLEIIETGMKMLFGGVWSHLNNNRSISLDDISKELIVTGKFGNLYA